MLNLAKKIGATALLGLAGCSSSPTESFTHFVGDPPETVYIDDKKISQAIVPLVIMPLGDKNSESCRFSGKIILPENLTYASYVEKILTTSLYLSDRLAKASNKNAPRLKIILNNVNFESYSGRWIMWGSIYVNESKITNIFSSLTFKSGFDNNIACSCAIDSFDNLCRKFILQIISHPKVIYAIKNG